LDEHAGASDDGKRYLLSFLQGVIAGYTWTNVSLKREGLTPLYCLNSNGARDLEKPVRMLKRASTADITLLDRPVGMAVLMLLKKRFPCRVLKTKKSPLP